MKNILFRHPVPPSKRKTSRWAAGAACTAALLLATANLGAATVDTLTGGPWQGNPPYYGNTDGDTALQAQFNTPFGLALDSSAAFLYVADRGNNAIRVLDLSENTTTTYLPIPGVTPAGTINSPVGVALDADDNLYVLNRGNGNNGTLLKFDYNGNGYSFANIASGLVNANALTLDAATNAYVTVNTNTVLQISPAGVQTIIATITNAGTHLRGICVMSDGVLAVCDSGRHGILSINPTTGVVTTNTGFNGVGDNSFGNNLGVPKAFVKFNQPYGLAAGANGFVVVADYGNNRVKVVNAIGTVTNLYGVSSNLWATGPSTWPGWWDGEVQVPDVLGGVEARAPNGLALAADGTLYATEDYYHLIRTVTDHGLTPPVFPPSPPVILTIVPNYGQISLTWSAPLGATNYNLKRSTTNGGPYIIIAGTSSTAYTDTNVLNQTTYYYVVSAVGPGGESLNSAQRSATVPQLPAPTILNVVAYPGQVTLTWSAIPAPGIGYHVKRSPSTGGPYTTLASTSTTAYTDTTVLSGSTYYYVISAFDAGGEGPNSDERSVWVPLPPVPDPQIGYVDFPPTGAPFPFTSLFHPVSSYVAYNDISIVIKGTPGSVTYYTYEYTADPAAVSNPTPASVSIPSDYQNGLYPASVTPFTVPQVAPALTIKALGHKPDGSPDSAIVSAQFRFVTANPAITGNNAAQFTISDLTTNAQMWYTIDGSTPTNAAPSLGPIPTDTTLSLQFPDGSNTLAFKVIAFRSDYQPSAVVTAVFSATNSVANTITFGFASGEASSDFIGSAGQTFYAPVTLNPLPGAEIYSLQFNLTVTNGGGNPGPALTPGAYSFRSFLEKPDLANPGYFITIPPAMFLTSVTNPAPAVPSTNTVFPYNDGWFQPLVFNDNGLNLLGVGWLERFGKTNLYDTTAQTLIDYSQPHDTTFTPAIGKVVLGGYSFQIPAPATAGQTYQIQIGRPSATSDGIGAPGSEVYIATPTNGSISVGAVNSIKVVTIGQRKYFAGDCAPFRWFNAGDFGNTNLNNSDVMQVFQSAIYYLNYPPAGSDFYDSMDSCGALGVLAPGGYLVRGPTISDPATLNLLFDGNDTLINAMPFGEFPQMPLDVCDVYVTFRRSLDPSLVWFSRFWTNGVLGAEPVSPQPKALAAAKDAVLNAKSKASIAFLTNPPSVNFAAADFTASAGQTLSVPITARIFGNYPVRVLMLSLNVEPLDGSPLLTSAIQFTPSAALGSPTMSASTGNGNYSATWLNNAIAGLNGTATLGYLHVTVPANAPSSAAYAIYFNHASASPNGIAPFPKQTLTGLILLSDRSSSIYSDGIPDSWRLRYFGTAHNILTAGGCRG